jgi:hypothetical protein
MRYELNLYSQHTLLETIKRVDKSTKFLIVGIADIDHFTRREKKVSLSYL